MSSTRNKRRLAKKKARGQVAESDPFAKKIVLAKQHHAAGRLHEAEQIYKTILSLNPNHLQALNLLGQLAMQVGRLSIAIQVFRRAVKAEPGNSNCYYLLGIALQRKGDNLEAESMLREANELSKNNPEILNALGLSVSYQGRFDEALQLFRQAINIDQNFIPAYHNLSTTKKFATEDDDLKSLAALYGRRHDFTDDNVASLCFAMGKACNDLGRYDAAFEAFDEGNKVVRKHRHFDIRDFERNYDRIEKYFTEGLKGHVAGPDFTQEAPIFVLGMPRSGTTLVENILCNHSDVISIGESALLYETLDQLSLLLASKDTNKAKNIYELLDSIDEKSLQKSGKYYTENMGDGGREARVRIIDKTPLNFLVVGLILQMIPNAIIVHCVRNPMDTCLSIFQQHFTVGHDYAYDLIELGQFYKLYQRYMRLWHTIFPTKIIDIEYESLVSDTEYETRRLLESCNLSWEEQCLSREGDDKSFNTASKLQVRQPIYQSSVERWLRYEKQLKPLTVELEQ